MTGLLILFVEDNADLRATIGEMIEEAGHAVVAVADAEAALALWQSRHFDALFTDISLPGMSGTDLARKVLARRPQQWVVFCSGYDPTQAMCQLGANVRAIPKAFECADLEAMLTEIAASLAAGARS